MSGLLLKLAAVVAGAAMLTTSPAAASYSITDDSIRPVPSVATVSKDAPGQDAPTPAPHPGTIEVSIPRVSFTADVRVVNGRVRTPVLVNVAAAPGIARVTGSRGACVERLTPGQVAWIDCAVRSRGPVAIVVALRDGTAATRVVRRCRPQGPPAAVPTRSSRPRLPLAPTTTRGTTRARTAGERGVALASVAVGRVLVARPTAMFRTPSVHPWFRGDS